MSGNDDNENIPDHDFYLQHFNQPVDSHKMEAIKVLIDQGAKKQKKGIAQKKMAVAQVLEA